MSKYEVVVVVYTPHYTGNVGEDECVYWDDNGPHPFERSFDTLSEAREYASTFDADMAMWAHTHGNGPEYESVAVDVVHDGVSVSIYEWVDWELQEHHWEV